MRTSSRPSRPSRPHRISTLELRHLALAVLGGTHDSDLLPAEVAVFDRSDGEGALAIRPLADDDPVAGLLGRRAPTGALAYGLVARGRGRSTGDADLSGHTVVVPPPPDPQDRPAAPGTGPPTPPSLVGRITIVHLVASPGWSVTCARGDGRSDEVVHEADGPTYQGRVDDVCRRVLGLATAAPAAGVEHYWAARWLVRVRARAAMATRPMSWEHLAGLHDGPGLTAPGVPRRSVPLGTWADLRLRAGRRPGLPSLAPAVARWMDDGIFSRTMLATVPDVPTLLSDLAVLLPDQVVGRAVGAVRSWGVEVGGAWPGQPSGGGGV